MIECILCGTYMPLSASGCLRVPPGCPWVPPGSSGCILGARGSLLGASRYSERIWVSWMPLGVFGWLLAAVVYSLLAKNQKSLEKTKKTNKTKKPKFGILCHMGWEGVE